MPSTRSKAQASVTGAGADRGEALWVPAPTPENPMRRNPLMQRMVANFHNCRTTPEGLISVLDALLYVQGSSREASNLTWGFWLALR